MSIWNVLCGTIIGNSYHLKKLLGAGNFGGVFLAEHIIDNQVISHVAVKMIKYDGTQQELNEILAGTNLNHPNLVRYLGGGKCHFQNTDLLYLVMELADGTLEDELKNRKLSHQEVEKLVSDIASGLEYLHNLPTPIVHRDLKPANILKQGDTWKIADFGLVTQIAQGTHCCPQLQGGTKLYMPPESYKNNVVSPAWDIWSLGIIILEALTHKYPYNLRSQNQFINDILHKEPTIPHLNSPWGKIVKGCLNKDRKARFTAEQVLKNLSSKFSFPSLPLPSWQQIQTIGICGGVVAIAISSMSMMSSLPSNGGSRGVIAEGKTEETRNNNPRCNAKANRIFHQRHPELNRRSIREDETKLAKEWLEIRNSLTNCNKTIASKKSQPKSKPSKQCVRETNRIFYQRHPELKGRSIREDETELAQDWRNISHNLSICGNKKQKTSEFITKASSKFTDNRFPQSTC